MLLSLTYNKMQMFEVSSIKISNTVIPTGIDHVTPGWFPTIAMPYFSWCLHWVLSLEVYMCHAYLPLLAPICEHCWISSCL